MLGTRYNICLMDSFSEVNKILSRHIPAQGLTKGTYTLQRMKQLMSYLGNPQEKYQVVHVAGTSGKTSTCYYLAALLGFSGMKVGLTVSPHIDEVNERVQINLKPLPEPVFANAFGDFMQKVDSSDLNPTYFELIVAFAYWYFAEQKVDCAVIETGMGGLLDGTNIVANPSKMCVITDIGLDHTELLGDTLSKVSEQKAGIIQSGNIVFCLEQSREAIGVIKRVADQKDAKITTVSFDERDDRTSALPAFQQRNWQLAYQSTTHLLEQLRLDLPAETAILKSVRTSIPGRMEVILVHNKTVILDGAHNEQKMHSLTHAIMRKFSNREITVVFALSQRPDKEVHKIINELQSVAHHMIIVRSLRGQDVPKKSQDIQWITQACDDLGNSDYEVVNNLEQGLAVAMARPEGYILVTGSIYLVASLRRKLASGDL